MNEYTLRNNAEAEQSLYCPGQPLFIQSLKLPQFSRQSAHEGGKIISSTHLSPLPRTRYPWYSFLLQIVSTPQPYVVGRIKSRKSPKDPVGNRTCGLPVCSTVRQPRAPPRAPVIPTGETRITRGKNLLIPFCSLHVPQEMTKDRTRVSASIGRRLTA